jgi:hypothetical protein
MNAGTPPLRDSLVGMWTLQAGGMQSEVTLQPDGNYSNTLAGGAQGHWGTWAVTDNPFGKMVVFTLAGAFPQEYVGPLGSTPIIWPKTESWQVTGVQPDRIDINGTRSSPPRCSRWPTPVAKPCTPPRKPRTRRSTSSNRLG